VTHSVKYLIGDTREQIATIADGTVSLVACSPPFIALRSYLPAEHPDKNKEIGSEPDPATFLDTLLQLTAEWGRVLTPWGSIAIELGDTYAGGSAQGTDQNGSARYPGGRSSVQDVVAPKRTGNWPRPKCLALIPQLYAIALAYGINPLTGQPSPAGQWLVRNVVVWHRPNPAVGALGDKVRPSTSYITIATRSPKRWFDLTAVRNVESNTTRLVGGYAMVGGVPSHDVGPRALNPAGAPPLDTWTDHHDTWTITTQPSSLAHYAMWPAKLAERLVLMMAPREVCTVCGEPRRRVEKSVRLGDESHANPWDAHCKTGGPWTSGLATRPETLGFTDCGHNNYQPGTVLDPFAGTGTTLAVAALHGRNAIGIDIDARNHALYPPRRAEVARNLFGSPIPDPDQLELFGVA